MNRLLIGILLIPLSLAYSYKYEVSLDFSYGIGFGGYVKETNSTFQGTNSSRPIYETKYESLNPSKGVNYICPSFFVSIANNISLGINVDYSIWSKEYTQDIARESTDKYYKSGEVNYKDELNYISISPLVRGELPLNNKLKLYISAGPSLILPRTFKENIEAADSGESYTEKIEGDFNKAIGCRGKLELAYSLKENLTLNFGMTVIAGSLNNKDKTWTYTMTKDNISVNTNIHYKSDFNGHEEDTYYDYYEPYLDYSISAVRIGFGIGYRF
jgi:hypothetical protein